MSYLTKEMQQKLIKFKQRFEDITSSDNRSIKKIRLEALLTDLETAFQIPAVGAIRIQAFNHTFPEVSNLYRKVRQAQVA